MAKWKKLLVRMLRDRNPGGYRYEEAASVLKHFGFEEAPSTSGTSHRQWRHPNPGPVGTYVGLVEKGHGTLKAYLIRDMIAALKNGGFIADEVEEALDDSAHGEATDAVE